MKEGIEQKKVWESPDLVVYGDINSLTQLAPPPKPKQPGSIDDFMVAGISSP